MITTATLMSGCASQLANFDAISLDARRKASIADESAARTIQRAQSKLELGKTEQLKLYAPRHLKLAGEQFLEAQEMYTGGEPDGKVKTVAMTSIKALDAGLDTKKKILGNFKPALDHREVLFNIKADKYFPTDFAGLEQALREMIDLMEDGKTAEANRQQAALLTRMHQVEANTIEYIQLQPVKDHLARIDEKGGSTVAAMSWETARKALSEAQSLIAKTPRAKAAIAKSTVAATRAAQHAEVITDMSNEILDASSDTAETLTLRVERWLYRIGVALKHKDIRHQPLGDQAAEYAGSIETMMRNR